MDVEMYNGVLCVWMKVDDKKSVCVCVDGKVGVNTEVKDIIIIIIIIIIIR